MNRVRLFITTELLVAAGFQLLQAFRLISASVFYLFLLGLVSLRLRKLGWKQLGLRQPSHWLQTIGIGTVVGVFYQFFSIWLVVPVLEHFTNRPLVLGQFSTIYGNFAHLVFWLAISWTIGAFGEEMVYRGYINNRVADLFERSQGGWIIALIFSSALFGLGHSYQGLTGVVETFLFGSLMAGLYFAGRGSLWLPVITHGVYDTTAFVLIFLGLYP
jgi:uncharacterized protein